MPLELEEREDKFTILHCQSLSPGKECGEFLKQLEKQVGRLAVSPHLRIVVDLKERAEFPAELFPDFSKLGESLQHLGKKIYFVNVPPQTEKLLRSPSLSTFVHLLYSSPVEAVAAPKSTTVETETALVNGLREGVLWTLHMVCPAIDVKAGAPFVKTKSTKIGDELAAQLGIKSRTFDGTVALAFPEGVYLKVMSAMHESDYHSLAEVPADGIRELFNMLRSITRKSLQDKGYVLDKEIPQALKGELMERLLDGFESNFVIPFDTPHGVFHCEVGFTRRKVV